MCTRLNQEFKVLPAGSEDEEQDMDQAYNSLASNLGIDHFSVMLRRAIKQEQDDLLGQAKRPKYIICAFRLHSIAVVRCNGICTTSLLDLRPVTTGILWQK